jgi:hypothetical protein
MFIHYMSYIRAGGRGCYFLFATVHLLQYGYVYQSSSNSYKLGPVYGVLLLLVPPGFTVVVLLD